jgi:hypothetical protein
MAEIKNDSVAHENDGICCPDALLPDGEICPRCGKTRAPSGAGGGSWVHYDRSKARVTTYRYGVKISDVPLDSGE